MLGGVTTRDMSLIETCFCSRLYGICDAAFYRKNKLKIHIESVHEGKKPYLCNDCGKAFSTKNPLKIHIYSVHEGEKTFLCNDCGKTFSRK